MMDAEITQELLGCLRWQQYFISIRQQFQENGRSGKHFVRNPSAIMYMEAKRVREKYIFQ